jgi:hypothetical protein
MHPIISGDEILIPLNYGDSVTNAPKKPAQFLARAHAPAPLPVYVPQPAPAQAVAARNNALQAQPQALPWMAPLQVVLPPVPAGPVAQIDFWGVIGRLSWVDKEDNFPPTLNPTRPSQKLTFAEWQAVQQKARPYYDALAKFLDNEDFWHKNGMADQDQAKFIWHVIARGQQIFDAVKNDASFGCGYIGQDCGFIDFMRNWS